MAWIECHAEIWEHWKTIRLCELLNKPIYAVVGHLVSLWHFALRNSPETGDLRAWGDATIEAAARWDGNAGVFVTALREVVYLDQSTIHGWDEFTLHYKLIIERRDRQKDQIRKRVKHFRDRRGNARVTLDKKTGNAPVTPCNAATLPNHTIPSIRDTQDRRKPFVQPTPEEVSVYAAGIGFPLEGSRFVDHYVARGWLIGKTPMRDWKAAVRTWKSHASERGDVLPEKQKVIL